METFKAQAAAPAAAFQSQTETTAIAEVAAAQAALYIFLNPMISYAMQV
jgi:hypothetical protein